jgi:hypothetical protein
MRIEIMLIDVKKPVLRKTAERGRELNRSQPNEAECRFFNSSGLILAGSFFESAVSPADQALKQAIQLVT